MKIGIEAQRIFRKKKHGMDYVALELIRNIAKIDHENEYIVFVKPGEDEKCFEATPNVRIVKISGAYPVWEQFKLPAAAKKEGVQILHCTSNTGPVNCSIPMVLTLHDIIYMESVALFKKGFTLYQKFGNMYRRLVVPRVLKNCRKIITVSKYEQKRIAEFFGIHDNRVVAVYNGVGNYFKPVTNQEELVRVKQKYNLPDRFLFFLGNTDPKKNTIGVLKAVSQLYKKGEQYRIPLVMLDYDREVLQKMLVEIGDPEMMKMIKLTGYVVNTELPAIYSACSVFLYPSLRESFGIPMIEAMASGAPLIASNTSCMPEVAGDAALFIDPFKPGEITDAIIRMLDSEELRQHHVQKGFERASHFSWQKMAEEVIKLYEEILETK
jgi:glycosyltransferase involved in cell wall biosynthesis